MLRPFLSGRLIAAATSGRGDQIMTSRMYVITTIIIYFLSHSKVYQKPVVPTLPEKSPLQNPYDKTVDAIKLVSTDYTLI